jgi:hypothetical protein
MRGLDIFCDVVIALVSVFTTSSLDFESRQRFAVELSLEELHANLILLNHEVSVLLASTRVNNPAAIFLSRSASRRAHTRRGRPTQPVPPSVSPLCVGNVDPSASTTTASRVMDAGVLLVEFAPLDAAEAAADAAPSASVAALKAATAVSKDFLSSVATFVELEHNGRLRIVKATPTMLLVLSDAAVSGRRASSKGATDIPLVELGLEVIRSLCPQHGMVGRAVADSGPKEKRLLFVFSSLRRLRRGM